MKRLRAVVALLFVIGCETKPAMSVAARTSITSREILEWSKKHYVPRVAKDLGGLPRLTLVAADGKRLLVEVIPDGGPLVGTVLLDVVEQTEQTVRVQVTFINAEGQHSSGPLLSLVKVVGGLDEFDAHAQ